MFSHLTDFEFKRTPLQALGFYILYAIVIMIAVGVVSSITEIGVDKNTSEYGNGARLGTFFAMAASGTIAFLVIKAKKMTGAILLSLLVAASGFLALIGGGVLGMIIPAVLTTKKGARG